MQRKILSLCVALALGNNAVAGTGIPNNTTLEGDTCPVDISILTKEERAKLPKKCLDENDNALWLWIAGGAAAITASVVALSNSGGGGDSDNHHVPIPDPTPDPIPDPTPEPHTGITVFNNNASINWDTQSVSFGGMTFSYSLVNGLYVLTAPDGEVLYTKEGAWRVDDNNNLLILGADSEKDYWTYDRESKFYHSDALTKTVIGENTHTVIDESTTTTTDHDAATIIAGNGAVVVINGDTTVTGGTGLYIRGGDANVDNNGDTVVDGINSKGVDITGDNAVVTQDGDSTVSGGGIGTNIDGDSGTVVLNGDTKVSGDGSAGVKINGDNAKIAVSGDLTVNGLGSTGVAVEGNNAQVKNIGKATVSDGATGYAISGNSANIVIDGTLDVSSTLPDIATNGVFVGGDQNSVEMSGKLNVGDFSTGLNVAGNNNNLLLTSELISVTGQQATGAIVSGDHNTVTLTGDILVDKDQTAPNAAEYFFTPSTGIAVSGSDNQVTVDGQLKVVTDSETTDFVYASSSGSQESISGLNITGNGNRVDIMGGVELTSESDSMGDAGAAVAGLRTGVSSTPIINIDGQSSLYLHGDSKINGSFPHGLNPFVQMSNNAYLELTEGSNLTIELSSPYSNVTTSNIFIILDSGSKFVNKGDVTAGDLMFAYASGQNSEVTNAANLTLERNIKSSSITSVLVVSDGAYGVNTGTITGVVQKQDSITNDQAEFALSDGVDVFNNRVMGIQGMTAITDNSQILNAKNANINLYGRGSVGMNAAENATALNDGNIKIDSLWVASDDTSAINNLVLNADAKDYGVGMAVGSDSYAGSKTQATAINHQEGVITIENAGAGMVAYGVENSVINQGTINLEKNENYDPDLGANKLVGIAVYAGGSAINDITGIININAENGQAFYNDGSGRIINRGKIIIGEGVPASADNSATTTSTVYDNGSVIAAAGETTTIGATGSAIFDISVPSTTVTNAGTVNGGSLYIYAQGTLVNESTGNLQNVIGVNNGGTLENKGTLSSRSAVNSGGILNNQGTISGQLQLTDGTLNNQGTISEQLQLKGGTVNNSSSGVINAGFYSTGASTKISNHGVISAANSKDIWMRGGTLINETDGTLNLVSGCNLENDNGSVVTNSGTIMSDGSQGSRAALTLGSGDKDYIINGGTISQITGSSDLIRSSSNATTSSMFWNQAGGEVDFKAGTVAATAVGMLNSNTFAVNDGVINISGNGAIAMKGSANAQLVNNGTINLGTLGTTDTGMIAMQLDANATADAVIENDGTININASNSFAFSKLGGNGRIVNTGAINFADGVTGSGIVQQAGITPETLKVATYTLPADPSAPKQILRNTVNHYTVGTTASGSAGQMMVDHADLDDVKVDTGFTAGTASKTASFDNVFQGADIQGAENIQSDSVVWKAEGTTDTSGNVDVTMTKNAYTDVADASVKSVAGALEAGYTNNALYQSLNLKSAADVTRAMKQLSGSNAVSAFNEARVLSNRFTMLSDTAVVSPGGLGFNVVAKGDKRAELGNDTQYDMLALSQKFSLSPSQSLTMQYGIARLDGSGDVKAAGDNGLTGGYSQFFGLEHSMALGESVNLDTGLRYDNHQLNSSRTIQYGSVNEVANSDNSQQYMELKSQLSRGFALSDSLNLKPSAGVKLRHTVNGGVKESGANDYNLSMSSETETAIDAIVGMELSYAGKNGLALTAKVEGGPNMSYSKSGRTASLQGAAGQQFSVNDDQKGGGVNGLASMGVSYNSGNTSMGLDVYNWQEDSVTDKGLNLNVKVNF